MGLIGIGGLSEVYRQFFENVHKQTDLLTWVGLEMLPKLEVLPQPIILE